MEAVKETETIHNEDKMDDSDIIVDVDDTQTSSTGSAAATPCEMEKIETHSQKEIHSENETMDTQTSTNDDKNVHSSSSPPLSFDITDSMSAEKNESDTKIVDQLSPVKDACYVEKAKSKSAENEESNANANQAEADTDSLSNKIVSYRNIDGKVTPSPIIQYVLDTEQPWDTVVGCQDGKIGAHRLVLAAASPFIGDLFRSRDHRLGEVGTLILPDIKVATMKVILNFCYTGQMIYPKESEEDVVDALDLLMIAEFATLSVKTVTVKLPDPTTVSTENGQQQNISDAIPGTSSSSQANDNRQEILSASTDDDDDESDNDDAEDDSGSGSEDGSDYEESQDTRQQPQPITRNEEMERINLANTFLRDVRKHAEEMEISYVVPPRPAGCKTKTFLCFHCPGAFKSTETLTDHLERVHGIYLQARNMTESEFKALTDCTYCPNKHTQISSANACTSKHHKTRCFICLELVPTKHFENHVKENHGLNHRNGMCIVKCRWCEAGMLLQGPIDNKAMSAHCFANHFPGGRNKVVIEKDKEENEDLVKSEATAAPQHSDAENQDFKMPIPFTSPPMSEKKKTKQQSMDRFVTPTTPSRAGLSVSNPNVPPVLMMLQKASQKRKLKEPESQTNNKRTSSVKGEVNPKKRPRLDSNGKQLQVAKRTGVPVGRQVDLNSLKEGLPSLTSMQQRSKTSRSKFVVIDVEKLPQVFVNFQYSKTYVLDYMKNRSSQQDCDEETLAHTPKCSEEASNTVDATEAPQQPVSNEASELPVPGVVEISEAAKDDNGNEAGAAIPS